MQQTTSESWVNVMVRAAGCFGLPVEPLAVSQQMRWFESLPLAQRLERLSHLVGLQIRITPKAKVRWSSQNMPIIAQVESGELLLLERLDAEGIVTYWVIDNGELVREEPLEELKERLLDSVVLLGIADRGRDSRIDEFTRPWEEHWFWKHFRHSGRKLAEISLASVLGNVLALGGILFSTQVYDRVIPAQSFPTLWVLFVGVLLAAVMEFSIRLARTHISDIMGKHIDLRVSSMFFARALAIKNDARPKSTGSFISQLREIDQVRELLTSTTVGAAMDMPFVLLFLLIMAAVGGPLVIIPIIAIPLIIIPGLLVQWPMARLAKEGMRESAIRNAVLVEAIEGIEDIKALQAEPYFQRQWEHTHAVGASIGMKQRVWGARLSGWASSVQQITYGGMLVLGSYLVLDGSITTGTMVACSLLSSRTIAPLMQLTMVFSRWQHAKSAMTGLNELLKKPLDKEADKRMAHCPVLAGHYQVQQMQYSYDVEKGEQALNIEGLEIKPGERVAILGKTGVGKSTLLRLLSGQVQATKGKIIIDGVDIAHIDPGDVRRQIGYLSQDSRLFFGTLRQNLMLGHPHATDAELIQA
ncbi:MAG: ABC transporter transmembrane domain-containing protein, partial [Kluyvera sp.]